MKTYSTHGSATAGHPTVWGLPPVALHDRFWAARGVQVVRLGDAKQVASDAELFLLTEKHCLTIFRFAQFIDTLNWLKPRLVFARLRAGHERNYRERVVTGDDGCFQRFERVYGDTETGVTRVALTPDPELAQLWRDADGSPSAAWRSLRGSVARTQRTTVSIRGDIYDRRADADVMRFMHDLIGFWRRPSATIRRAARLDDAAWGDADTSAHGRTRFVGPVWVGTGRRLDGVENVVGPAVLWDAPDARPDVEGVRWDEIEPAPRTLDRPVRLKHLSRAQRGGKRAFDLFFSLLALMATLPLYPLVILAIYLEDGPPFFFAHRRESRGGREFPCIKFRTMRHDAEEIKQRLIEKNQADGPQFFIEDDPRMTKVGKVLRKLNLDELPQFFNVLVGHMSVVGPRPSPRKENQFCPAWREARLSVRPGITGLWQVRRSRLQGQDFQEWIRYDIEYVEKWSWKMDLWLIFKTFGKLLGR